MRVLLLLSFLLIAPAAGAERATERYAPAQLGVARELYERARARAALGQLEEAGELAQQASLDARLTWGMTDSPELRAEAAAVGGAAAALLKRLPAAR